MPVSSVAHRVGNALIDHFNRNTPARKTKQAVNIHIGGAVATQHQRRSCGPTPHGPIIKGWGGSPLWLVLR